MSPTDAERAWAAMLRLHATLVPQFDRELRAAVGLPLAWYDVLLELNSAGEPLRMTELGDRVVLSRTRVSRIVDELIGAGLVRREANREDGRSSFVELTDEGTRRFREAAAIYQESIRRSIRLPGDPSQLGLVADTLESCCEAEAAEKLTDHS